MFSIHDTNRSASSSDDSSEASDEPEVVTEKEEEKKQKKQFPSLAEQMGIVQEWWKIIDNYRGNYEQPIKRVAEFFVKKNIATD